MLNWANRFNIFCLLDNQQYHFESPVFECLLAVGAKKNIVANAGNAFTALKAFSISNKGSWLFGHLCYDLKNETEQLQSGNIDGINFPDLHFFEPEIVLQLTRDELVVTTGQDAALVFQEISACSSFINQTVSHIVPVNNRIAKQQYMDTIKKIQSHILRGDCYEINFCQEFFAEAVTIDPVAVYSKLSVISPNPFAALYKFNDKYCICASPERYIKRTGNQIISQPIKGTAQRNLNDQQLDNSNREELVQSEKERSENVMVVDLVRNDLSRICTQGSVKVDELFGIYSFPQVHQMISTISGQVADDLHWVDIIKATFPMGSMTGAPKKRVMELIEQYEQTKRGLFSGAIGYIKPNGNFDFNVVIRSVLYNAGTRYLSYQTGGAITFNSNAEAEYEECLLKATAIKQVLE
ncbi:MAG: anthranilate synthase component I family protein [Chitinophagaceae bacterium]|nr:anthranilate synthase component I family protein [Chitinophagaceae bacterium]